VTLLDHFRLMATYNAWMNGKLYDAAAKLSADELARDRGAFFGSILGTLNHVAVADILWLKRFESHPAARPALDRVLAMHRPAALDEPLAADLGGLRGIRDDLDRAIVALMQALDEPGLDLALSYRRTEGEPQKKQVAPVLAHVFNHQTHHRGQATTLLCQAGVDVGVTDLNALTPNLA
jgi:uncharacterized damage-inducible protein DinB